MSVPAGFTAREQDDIETFYPELEDLKRNVSLRKRTTNAETRFEMSVAAAVRWKIIQLLVSKYPRTYSDISKPETLYLLATLDSVSNIHSAMWAQYVKPLTAFEDLLRGTAAGRQSRWREGWGGGGREGTQETEEESGSSKTEASSAVYAAYRTFRGDTPSTLLSQLSRRGAVHA